MNWNNCRYVNDVRPFWDGRRNKVGETPKLEPHHQKNRYPFLIKKKQDKYKGTQYYDSMWKSAIDAQSDIIVINSFNGWLDSTEIEPAFSRPGYEFNENIWSGPQGKPNDYLISTKKWIGIYKADKLSV